MWAREKLKKWEAWDKATGHSWKSQTLKELTAGQLMNHDAYLASNPVVMASNLIAMASNLLGMAWNLASVQKLKNGITWPWSLATPAPGTMPTPHGRVSHRLAPFYKNTKCNLGVPQRTSWKVSWQLQLLFLFSNRIELCGKNISLKDPSPSASDRNWTLVTFLKAYITSATTCIAACRYKKKCNWRVLLKRFVFPFCHRLSLLKALPGVDAPAATAAAFAPGFPQGPPQSYWTQRTKDKSKNGAKLCTGVQFAQKSRNQIISASEIISASGGSFLEEAWAILHPVTSS